MRGCDVAETRPSGCTPRGSLRAVRTGQYDRGLSHWAIVSADREMRKDLDQDSASRQVHKAVAFLKPIHHVAD